MKKQNICAAYLIGFLLACCSFASAQSGASSPVVAVEYKCDAEKVCEKLAQEFAERKNLNARRVESFTKKNDVADLEFLTAEIKERGARKAAGLVISVTAFEFSKSGGFLSAFYLSHKLRVIGSNDLIGTGIAELIESLDKDVFAQFRAR